MFYAGGGYAGFYFWSFGAAVLGSFRRRAGGNYRISGTRRQSQDT